MFLKPRATQKNPQATVYRHYLEQVEGLITLEDDLGVETDKVISGYQVNKYSRYKDFDYIITSNEDTSQIQYQKGLIVEETTFDIIADEEPIQERAEEEAKDETQASQENSRVPLSQIASQIDFKPLNHSFMLQKCYTCRNYVNFFAL